MRTGKRPEAAISGSNIARTAAAAAGRDVRLARRRRRLTQAALASKVGLSRARLAEIEAGLGSGAPLGVWFAIVQALERYLRFEFGRDPLVELVDAGHLAIQELVIRVAKAAGWEVQFEAASRPSRSGRSIDVRLIDRKARRIVIVECWNTFGDLGEAARGSSKSCGMRRSRQWQSPATANRSRSGCAGSCATRRATASCSTAMSTYSARGSRVHPRGGFGCSRAVGQCRASPVSPGAMAVPRDCLRTASVE